MSVMRQSYSPEMISKQTQKCLLQAARDSVNYYMLNHQLIQPKNLLLNTDPLIHNKQGVFVTIKLNNKLRGCIGSITSSSTIIDQVITHSVNAAIKDPRFDPITQIDTGNVAYEISILTKPTEIQSSDQIDIPKHGVILAKNGKRAVFLPKVAAENNWDLQTTLTQLCKKAGLEADDWKRHARVAVFEAIEFKE